MLRRAELDSDSVADPGSLLLLLRSVQVKA